MIQQRPDVIRLIALGDARIETPTGVSITPRAELVFATALLLILEGHASRRRLERILWPDIEGSAASHRLRQTLVKLRKVGFIISSSQTEIAVGVPIWLDYQEIVDSPEKAAEQISFEVLPDYAPSFSREFGIWLDEKRDRIAGLINPMMLTAIAKAKQRGSWRDVERLARSVITLSPYNEPATLALAEALTMRGEKLESEQLLERYSADVGAVSKSLAAPANTLKKRLGERSSSAFHQPGSSPFVGREEMIERLTEMLSKSRAGKGKTCLVWGDPGIGKSRLLFELAAIAAMQGVKGHRIQCRPSDVTRPLSLFVDLVPTLRTLPGAIGCSPETMKYLDLLTKRRPFDELTPSDHTESQLVYSKVEGALFDLFEAITDEVTVLVVIEDVQFLDSASVRILNHLIGLASEHRLMFALSTRERPDWWRSLPVRTGEWRLPPLSNACSKELITAVSTSGGQAMDPHYVEWCVSLADGNPFFLEELGKQWLETGGHQKSSESLSIILEDRISRLSPESLRLLQTSAALEDHSTFELVEQVLSLEPHVLLQALETLSQAGMLLGDSRQDPNQPFLIHPRHEFIASAALERLSDPARAFLHRRIAVVLEAQISGNDSSALLWDTAKHWQMAGDARRALSLARSCGVHLLDLGMPDDAALAFDKALGFCITARDRIDVLRAQAISYGQANKWDGLLKTERTIRSLAVQTGLEHPEAHDELELLALRALWKSDTDETALSRLMVCLNASTASADHRAKAGTQALMLQDVACRHAEMYDTYRIIETVATQPGVSPVAILEADLVFHTLCGSLKRAIAAGEKLMAIQQDGGRRIEGFRHLQNASVPYRIAGDFDKSIACLTEAIDIARAHRLPNIVVRALLMLAHLALERGEIDEAASWHEEMTRHEVGSGDVYLGLDEASVRIRLSIAGLTISRPVIALDEVNPRSFPRIGQARTYWYALYTALKLHNGFDLTSAELKDFRDAYTKSRRCIAQAFGTYVLYAALTRLGETQQADELLRSYHTIFRRETWQASKLFDQIMLQCGAA